MIVHWGQLLATVASAGTVAAFAAAAWRPFGKRREQRKLDALTTAATLAKVEMRETMTEIVTTAVDQVKADTIARIDESDRAAHESFAEVKADVKDVRARTERQELAMATQFGGNGDGIRQAINTQGQQIATLVGRFDQHITETGK